MFLSRHIIAIYANVVEQNKITYKIYLKLYRHYSICFVTHSLVNHFTDMVEQLIENSSGRKTLHDTCLRKIPDLESLSIKLSDKRAGLADLYKIYMGVKEIEKIAEVFHQMSKNDTNILNEHFGVPFVKKLDKMEKFQVSGCQ